MNKIFRTLEERLAAAGNGNPRRSVEELAAHVMGCRPLEIYFREMSAEQSAELERSIARAEKGEPIQYIIGYVDFRGLEILCDSRALIPRPETELLVEEVLTFCPRFGTSDFLRIADVCTGTGCIGLALAQELPNARIVAIDISSTALELAQENAQRLGLSEKFQTLENNLLEGVAENAFDIVVSNPPYIFSNVWKTLDVSVKEYEPQLALDGGEDGMDLITPFVEQAAKVLKPGGGLFLEIGCDQRDAVFQCLEQAGFNNVQVIQDHSGLNRIVYGNNV